MRKPVRKGQNHQLLVWILDISSDSVADDRPIYGLYLFYSVLSDNSCGCALYLFIYLYLLFKRKWKDFHRDQPSRHISASLWYRPWRKCKHEKMYFPVNMSVTSNLITCNFEIMYLRQPVTFSVWMAWMYSKSHTDIFVNHHFSPFFFKPPNEIQLCKAQKKTCK